jgi:hypothetical protein
MRFLSSAARELNSCGSLLARDSDPQYSRSKSWPSKKMNVSLAS